MVMVRMRMRVKTAHRVLRSDEGECGKQAAQSVRCVSGDEGGAARAVVVVTMMQTQGSGMSS